MKRCCSLSVPPRLPFVYADLSRLLAHNEELVFADRYLRRLGLLGGKVLINALKELASPSLLKCEHSVGLFSATVAIAM